MDNDKLETSLVNSISSENLHDILVDTVGLTLDQFLVDGLLKDIPFFGLFYKIFKTTTNIRDAIFAKKLIKFLTQLKDIPIEKRVIIENNLGVL
jgi:hypothetical protein